MVSPSSAKAMTFARPRLGDLIEHDDEDVEAEGVEEEDGGDADDEDDGTGDDDDEVKSDDASQMWHVPYEEGGSRGVGILQAPSSASLPGTPNRGAPSQSPWRYCKDYGSETEAAWWPGDVPHDKRRQHHLRRQRMMREAWLDHAWQTRRQRRQLGERGVEVTVVIGGEPSTSSPWSGGGGGVAMDMEEVRACRDLGFDLPCDWSLEIPSNAVSVSNADTASSGGNSPVSGSWRISSPGDDPKDVKARLKVWAQAVALSSASASASRFGS